MLDSFFRINLPYGISRNYKGEWMAFNREYMPLGYNTYRAQESMGGEPNSVNFAYQNLPIHTKYTGITEAKLIKLAHEGKGSILRDENNKIYRIFLYDDRTSPANNWGKSGNKYWIEYIGKLEILSRLNSAD